MASNAVISSRTPEVQPNCCPVCRKGVAMEPSQPFGDAPCPHCGCLLRFEPLSDGVQVSVAKATATETREARSMYACPRCKTRIPFGTETVPPPDHCPNCQRRLFIPTELTTLPPEWLARPEFQSDPVRERLSGRAAMQVAKNLTRHLWEKLRTMWYNVHVG